jgi:uncharacterized cupredoxin-like copper-binding protein
LKVLYFHEKVLSDHPDAGSEEDKQNGNGSQPESDRDDDFGNSPYTFNGRVILGVGIIIAIAAASSIFAASISQSSQIRLTSSNPLASIATTSASALQQSTTMETPANKRFVLVAHDFGWNGTTNGPTIQVNKGDVVHLTFINAGQMAHNFGIAKLSKETTDLLNKTQGMSLEGKMNHIPYDAMSVLPCPGCEEKFDEGHIETFILPDQEMTATFTANEAGHFNYFCQVRGHIWLGMIGDLIVLDQPARSNTNLTTATAGGSQ